MRIVFCLCWLSWVQFALADSYPRNEAIDIKHYIFHLELNDTTDSVAGEAIVRLLARKVFSTFELDLVNRNTQGKGMNVSGVWMNGRPVSFNHHDNRLRITLASPAEVNQQLEFTIRYDGIPIDGLIITRNKYGDRTFFGDNWPDRARNWLPCIDHPYDKAGVDFIVTAPLQYTVVGNGIKLEESYLNPNQKRTHWHEAVDLPTKVMVIGAARFAIRHVSMVDHIPVESWVYPQNRTEGFADYEPAAAILAFFHNHIGPYSYKKLVSVQSTTIYGGMENASNIFYYENSVSGRREINNLIAHEVAHQWFGNSATEKDWHHVWLSEGFATYFTHVYNEFTYGRQRAAEDLARDRAEVIAYCKKAPAPIINTAIMDYKMLLTPHVYHRAGWVLHILRKEIGDEAFFTGVREYYRTFQNSNALTSDLQLIMESVSGKDLAYFFQQWLYRSELPALRMDWSYNPKSQALTITIEQMQKGGLFDLPLDIEVVGGAPQSARAVEAVRINEKVNKLVLKSGSRPAKVTLDPGVNLLFEEISRK